MIAIRGLAAALTTTAVALVGLEASAQVRPVRIDYEAHEGCPDAAAFLGEVTSRTSLARAAAGEDEGTLDVRVRITRAGDRSRGQITFGKGEDLRVREVDGPICVEVVGALAFITALKIDPRASSVPRAPAAASASDSASASAPASAPASASASAPAPVPASVSAPVPVPASASASAPASASVSVSAPASASAPARRLRSTLGVHASSAFGVAPRALFGGGPFVELRVDSHLHTSFRLAAEIAAAGTVDLGPGGAFFTQSLLRLDACPAFLRLGSLLAVAPCFDVEGGFLRAEGRPGPTISDVKQVTVPWASLGAHARVAIDAGDVLKIDLQGGPQFPLVRRSFVFEDPAFLIHEVPAVTWTLRLGAGLSF